jgi:hypothetical protein
VSLDLTQLPVAVERALKLTQRAFDVLKNEQDPLAECVDGARGKTDPVAWRKAQDQYRLTPSQTQLPATVYHDEGTSSVWLSEDGGLAKTALPQPMVTVGQGCSN